MAINFPTLSSEIWVRIAQYGAFTVCPALSQVSKLFYTIVKAPALAKNWKREVYAAVDLNPGLLLDFLLEGRGSWREIFLAYVVVQRSLAIRQPYIENGSFRASVLTVAKNTIDPLILLEGHFSLDVEESIEDMKKSQRRMQPPKTYETLFFNLKMLDIQQQEDPEVCYYLSECYFRGIGTKANPEKAFAYALAAARTKCVPACCNLGAFYAKGYGVLRNYNEAVTWLEPLTAPQAKFFLGMIEKSVELDFDAAFTLFEEAAIGGHAEAQYLTGLYYLGYGDEGVEYPVVARIDPVKSFTFFKLSAHQGHIEAICRLGNCYLQGFGTQKCFEKGFTCLKLASRYGSSRYCSAETFAGIESEEDRHKMWQFLEEGAKRGSANSNAAMWSISQKLEG